ncbi:MAG: hypothetical protein NVV73_03945 [Cellvibrionaceae bacterium]|nr:hypothetical protein [Cellvibrionaceae bacterium]
MRGVTGLLLGICLLSLIACGGKKKHYASADEGLANIEPYVASSTYSAVLKRCATATNGRSCTLEELPALGMEIETPEVADIMERTLVSHPWMGARFEEVLEEMPVQMRYLFGSLTAVVIDDDVRPSYYNPRTATIYLDPDYLWLTEQELAVINQKEDFRGEYIRRMAYRPVWRYVNGPDDDTRSLDTIVVDTAQLLFHELAHANDIFPRTSFANVNRALRVEDVTASLYDEFPSTRLLETAPLKSDVMFRLARILYHGDTPSDNYRRVGAALVGSHFEPDGANDDYNYSSQYEDVAMLFEEAMMKAYFDMDRDVGFTSAPNSPFCEDYILGWGMRNRLGAEQVKERAEWVVAQLLPNEDYTWLFESLPEPQLLQTNVSWCDSEPSLSNSAEKTFAAPGKGRLINPRNLQHSGALQTGI